MRFGSSIRNGPAQPWTTAAGKSYRYFSASQTILAQVAMGLEHSSCWNIELRE